MQAIAYDMRAYVRDTNHVVAKSHLQGGPVHDDPSQNAIVLNSLRKMFASPAPTTNHRRWHRIVMSEPARVSTQRGESRAAMLDEICAGGARVKISQRLAPGSVIGIDFKTAAGGHHCLNARVVHALKDERGFAWRCGVCFIDAEPAQIRRLDDYVEEERKRREVGFAMPRN